MASPLATPGLKNTQFLLASDMKIIEKYQNSSLSHEEDILVFYHTTSKLLYMTWGGCLYVTRWDTYAWPGGILMRDPVGYLCVA